MRWYLVCLLVLIILLTILVLRLSEVSTRIITLEENVRHAVQSQAELHDTITHCVTHRDLYTALNVQK